MDEQNLHTKFTIPALEDAGWEKMSRLLDNVIPVKKIWYRTPYVYSIAAAFLLFMLCPFLTSDEKILSSSVENELAVQQKNNTSANYTKIFTPTFHSDRMSGKNPVPTNAIILNDKAKANTAAIITQHPALLHVTSIIYSGKLTSPTLVKSKKNSIKNELNFDSGTNKKKLILKHKQPIEVLFSLNRNISNPSNTTFTSLYGLPVYPSIKVTFPMYKKLGLYTGISAFVPGQTTNLAYSKTVSATGALPLLYENQTLQNLYYWQLAVGVQYKIDKHFAMSAGVNFAFLQKAGMQLEKDNLSNTGDVISDTRALLLSPTQLASTDLMQSYTVKHFDPRINVGLFYSLKKFTFGAEYTQAIRASLKDDISLTSERNRYFSISAGIKL